MQDKYSTSIIRKGWSSSPSTLQCGKLSKQNIAHKHLTGKNDLLHVGDHKKIAPKEVKLKLNFKDSRVDLLTKRTV